MSLFGTLVTVLIGPTVPTPAPPQLVESIDSIEVNHSDERRSGFRINLRAGRGREDTLDYGLLSNPLLKPFNRVVLLVTFNAVPEVLFDGIITDQQLAPGNEPGTSTLSITGEDVSVMMDLEEKFVEHPAQNEMVIALKIIASYAQYGLIPTVIPPPTLDVPLPTERIPVQQATDLDHLQQMAARHAYVFYVAPGPAPLTNTAYWGPPMRVGVPQKALSVSMGPNTNVRSMNFRYQALAPTTVSGKVQDRTTNEQVPVQTFTSTRIPLSAQPASATQSHTRTRQFRGSGLNVAQAFSKAQADTDASNDQVIVATGQLDATQYEAILKPRGLVGMRGAGYSYDGIYYVRQVTHNIRVGEYNQRFTLNRGGLGATTPTIIP